MSKKVLISGLFVALLASLVGGAFSAPNAHADDPITSILHSVRNVTRGGIDASSITGYAGDRVRFTTIVTTGNHQIFNFRATDILPAYLHFVSGSTTVNGAWYADAIATSGLSLGTLPANSAYTIQFDATIDTNAVGYSTLVNTMSITSETAPTQTRVTSIALNGSVTPAMSVSETGRNVTLGQSREYTSLRARPGDTLDIIVRIRASLNSVLTNVYVTNPLPAGLAYIPGSTTINGIIASDGITTSGITFPPIAAGYTTTIKFSARVNGAYVPSIGTSTITNTTQVRADEIANISVRLPITLGLNLTAISSIQTGPADALWLSALVALLATGCYALYTRTSVFGHRMAVAEITRLQSTKAINFLR